MQAALALVLVGGGVAAADRSIGVQTEIPFAFDSSALPANADAELARVAMLAREYPEVRIVLEGHTDPVGTYVYNVGLSIRRVDSVRAKLLALGVDGDRLVEADYGKNGTRRLTHYEDRRVTVWTTRDSLTSITDRVLGTDGVAVMWSRPRTIAEIDAPVEAVARK